MPDQERDGREKPERRRYLGNRRSVKLADHTARALITFGGFSTIGAVLLVILFLVWVAAALWKDAGIEPAGEPFAVAATTGPMGIDENHLSVWRITADGELVLNRAGTGGEILRRSCFADGEGFAPTAWSVHPFGDGVSICVGSDAGALRFGTLRYKVTFVPEEKAADDLRDLAPGEMTAHGSSLIERNLHGQIRKIDVEVAFGDPIEVGEAGIVALSHLAEEDERRAAFARPDGSVGVVEIEKSRLSGDWKVDGSAELVIGSRRSPPLAVLLDGFARRCYVLWKDGTLQRHEVASLKKVAHAETVQAIPDEREVTAFGHLAGRRSLLIGDSAGRVHVWWPALYEADTEGGQREAMVRGHLIDTGSRVTALVGATRSRLFAAAGEDGSLRVYNATTEQAVVRADAPSAPRALAFAPKADALLARGEGEIGVWSMDPEHHQVTTASMVFPVHYERYPEKRFIWQTTGDDTFEPKYSMWVLVFGTLKATFYSLIFAVPLALLAAIYTSEFMNKRVRSYVKPTMELMASLPSVILGFVAGLVVAVWAEEYLAAVLAAVFTVPFALLCGAHIWLLLPRDWYFRHQHLRLIAVAAWLLLGGLLAWWLGPWVVSWMFEVQVVGGEPIHDLETWLRTDRETTMPDGTVLRSSATGGWFVMMLPLTAMMIVIANSLWVKPAMQQRLVGRSDTVLALTSLASFVIQTAVVLALTLALSWLVGQVADLRGSIMGAYVQKNALVVGFVMGFAVVPIIYTIAEDALGSVPNSLRSASLGCGATPMQTALRIIVPTAMSGLFSAVMIGLGRAVGETMIVLMAAGNTPEISMNIFNGFRTLSANIAVELPESVRNSTHFRILFLSAVVLFSMTFVLNTAAEAVRMRFRKRTRML